MSCRTLSVVTVDSAIQGGDLMSHNIKIGFRFEDQFGHKYSQASELEVFDELGENDLDTIGHQLNCFLKQCCFVREKDFILMESLSEDEAEALYDYLTDLREDSNE